MAFQSFSKKVKATGVDDMVLLTKLTTDEITENLKKRHANDVIYTYISDVLIAMNPYCAIPGLYAPEQIEMYRGKYRHELPPHVFAIAEDAYRNLVNNGESQCVIISGESGAGKTETSKLIMQFIAAVSGHSGKVEKVKRVILETNPLLEAFGNAKTLRNDNSSRFGKYFEIQFNTYGEPVGGKISNYLLEKSRVAGQAAGERNFHIFYQFCYGATKQDQQKYHLKSAEHYRYLNQSGCLQIDHVDDSLEFTQTMKAMDAIGLGKDEQENILRIVAAVLNLGNITFNESGGKTDVENVKPLQESSELLKVSPDTLKRILLFRKINVGGMKKEEYDVPQNPDQAGAIRDALAKALYDRLFTWLIQRVNKAMVSNESNKLTIGILDIYGFEIFENNSFEQFCINFVNEKLQQIFIDLTLAQEEAEYKREGLKFEPIKYFNNKIVCDLIEGVKPPGLLAVLDDTCSTTHSMEPPKADEKFYDKMSGAVSNPHFHPKGTTFTIQHYAGPVTYNIYGFTEKNKDTLYNTLIEAMQTSSISFIAQLFADDIRESKKPTTAGFKIKKSCTELVEALRKCTPHYIRCIKPNDQKQPRVCDYKRTLFQVQYLGLLENIKVRRAGYAYRQVYDKFFERFRLLSKKTWPDYKGHDWKAACTLLMEDLQVEKGEWQLGETKLFLKKPETLFSLEEMKERKYHDAAALIVKTYQTHKLRSYFIDLRDSATALLESKKERRRLSINRIYTGDYLNYLNNAQIVEVMKAHKSDGGVLFADFFEMPVPPKLFGKTTLTRLFGLVTRKSFYLLERVKDKKQFVIKMMRKIPIEMILEIRMSCLADNFLVIVAAADDLLLECQNKTEFLSVVNDIYKSTMHKDIARVFNNQLDYQIQKGKKREIKFQQDATGKQKLASITSSSGKWVVTVPKGLPVDSKPKTVKRPQPTRKAPVANKQQQQQQPQDLSKRASIANFKNVGLKTNRKSVKEQAPSHLVYEQVNDDGTVIPAVEDEEPPQSLPAPIVTPAPVIAASATPSSFKAANASPIVAQTPSAIKAASLANVNKQPAQQSAVSKQVSSPVVANTPPAVVPRKAPPAPPKKVVKAKVNYAYTAAAADEVDLTEGEIVIVNEQDPSGWWNVTNSANRTGLCPGNYCELIK